MEEVILPVQDRRSWSLHAHAQEFYSSLPPANLAVAATAAAAVAASAMQKEAF